MGAEPRGGLDRLVVTDALAVHVGAHLVRVDERPAGGVELKLKAADAVGDDGQMVAIDDHRHAHAAVGAARDHLDDDGRSPVRAAMARLRARGWSASSPATVVMRPVTSSTGTVPGSRALRT